MKTVSFSESFSNPIPIFAMLHLKGASPGEKFDQARREIEVLWSSGVDAVVVENYYGTRDDVIAVCDYLHSEAKDVVFGVNVLRNDWDAFAIANEYGAHFIQLDSVAGHLPVEADVDFGERLLEEKEASAAYVLGGVRFKYQPYLSGRTLEEDLRLGMERSDVIVVTGVGTGKETPAGKTGQFRRIVGPDFPLVVGAGVTPTNCREVLADANGVIVGSYLKDTYQDTGDVDREHTLEFVRAIRQLGHPLAKREEPAR